MKRIFTLVCALLLLQYAKAQVLLSESFEATPAVFPPTGWTTVNAGTGNNWARYNNSQLPATITPTPDGSNFAGYFYSQTAAADAWLFTPSLSLTANVNYRITFIYAVASASFPERLRVTIGNTATVSGQTTVLWVNGQSGTTGPASLTNTAYATASIAYTPTATGNYNLGFNCYSTANQYLLMMDAVKVEQLNVCSGTPVAGTAVANNSGISCSGSSVVLSLQGTTSATNLTYQWQSSPAGAGTFTNIANATGTTLTVNPSTTLDYRAVVTCPTSSASSNSTVVRVNYSTPPPNDLICDAATLTRNGNYTCTNTLCATATATTDGTFKSSVANNTVWYQYTPTSTGPVEFRFRRPTGVATSDLLNGWAVLFTADGFCPDLTTTRVGGADSINFDLTTRDSVSFITASLTAGTTYYLYIDGFSGSAGQFCVSMPVPPSAVPTCSAPVEPANGATITSSPVTLRYRRSTLALTYDFYLSTNNGSSYTLLGSLADTAVSLTLTNPGTYFWYVVPRNVLGAATGCQSNARSFIVLGPSNDSCGAPLAISSTAAFSSTNVLASQSSAPETCSGETYTIARDVWFRFTANSAGTASIRVVPAAGSALDPVVALYTGTPGTNCAGITLVDCRDTYVADTLNTAVTNGTTYYVRVWGYNNTSGAFTVQINGIVLPITLKEFTGERRNGFNALSWTTATEQNNKGFEVERSYDGINFGRIGFVASQDRNGNSSLPLTYGFNDERAGSATVFYRLKQVDFDGRSSLSNVVTIKGEKATKVEITTVYPNPVKSMVNVALRSPESGRVSLVVTDMAGRVVSTTPAQLVAGDNNLRVNMQGMRAGSYLLKAVDGEGNTTATKVLVKE